MRYNDLYNEFYRYICYPTSERGYRSPLEELSFGSDGRKRRGSIRGVAECECSKSGREQLGGGPAATSTMARQGGFSALESVDC